MSRRGRDRRSRDSTERQCGKTSDGSHSMKVGHEKEGVWGGRLAGDRRG